MEYLKDFALPILSIFIGSISALITDMIKEKQKEKKNQIKDGKMFIKELLYYKYEYHTKPIKKNDKLPEKYKMGLPVNPVFEKFLQSKNTNTKEIENLIYDTLYENKDDLKLEFKKIEDIIYY